MKEGWNMQLTSYTNSLKSADQAVFDIIQKEEYRQKNHIELIASENFVSNAVLEAAGSILTNKYAEGYSSRRYYSGCEFVDEAENLAIARVCKLFNANFANVQPHSGSQANQAAFMALLKPGDTILGMSLSAGGHLTHGASPNLSGKWFNVVQYGVRKEDFLIDYDEILKLAKEHKPKLIIAGYSAHSRHLDFRKFREIADEVGAYLMTDIAHIAGLVATGLHESPLPHSHIVTSTTHKTLRGPRGGLILTNDAEIAKKVNSALFPGIQGGPLMHIIAAKAVAFGEALAPEYHEYMKSVVENARSLSDQFIHNGYDILTGGTDNHMLLLDLRKHKITGKDATESLERAFIACNKNSIPFDDTSPTITSGLRIGTPACTTRGFGKSEFNVVADLICKILDSLQNGSGSQDEIESDIRKEVDDLLNP
jgi:glycine hydroxymethyltransferase